MHSESYFTKTSPVRLFFLLAVPGMIGMLASTLYQTVDGIFVGQFLGDTAFAALNLAMPFVIINFAVADMIGVGSAVPISVCLGKGQQKEANAIFTCSCILIVGAGVVVGAVLYAFAPLIMGAMGAEGEFAALAVDYLRVYALCSPVTTIVFAMDNYLRISGYVRYSMILNIAMSALSAGIELLFLAVFRWGIWAAALASCTGMMLCALAALIPFVRGRAALRFCRPRFSLSLLRQIVSCGSPSFLNNVASRVTSIVMNAMLVRMGGESAVSVYGVLMYADGFIQPLLYGMCDSLQPAVGYNWGAGRYSRVRAFERCCFIGSAILSVIMFALIMLIPAPIAGLFIQDSAAVSLDAAAQALRLFSFAYLIRWFSFATQSYMLAIEKSLPAALISVSVALIFPMIWLAILYPLGLSGIWLNYAGTSLLAALLSFGILFGLRKKLRQPDHIAQQEETP